MADTKHKVGVKSCNTLKISNLMGGVSLTTSQLLKGIACIVVALHHYSQYVLSTGLSDNLFYFVFSTQGGYSGVALFFFLSGYGLMESETSNHLNLRMFIKKRFWKIYKSVLIVNCLTCAAILIWQYMENGFLPDISWIKIFSIKGFDHYFWFIEVLLYCYGFFFLSTQLRGKHKRIVALVVASVILPVVLWFFGESMNHLFSIPLFFVGSVVSMYKTETAKLVNSWIFWLAVLLLAAVAVLFIDKITVLHVCCNILTIIVLLWITSRFHYENKTKIPVILGTLSFPIYLVHHKVIEVSAWLGHLVPVWLFVIMVVYLGYLLYQTEKIFQFNNTITIWKKTKSSSNA